MDSLYGKHIIVTGAACHPMKYSIANDQGCLKVDLEGTNYKLNIGATVAYALQRRGVKVVCVSHIQEAADRLYEAFCTLGADIEVHAAELLSDSDCKELWESVPEGTQTIGLVHCAGSGKLSMKLPDGRFWVPYDNAILPESPANLEIQARTLITLLRAWTESASALRPLIAVIAAPVTQLNTWVQTACEDFISSPNHGSVTIHSLEIGGIVDSGVLDSEGILIVAKAMWGKAFGFDNLPITTVNEINERCIELLAEPEPKTISVSNPGYPLPLASTYGLLPPPETMQEDIGSLPIQRTNLVKFGDLYEDVSPQHAEIKVSQFLQSVVGCDLQAALFWGNYLERNPLKTELRVLFIVGDGFDISSLAEENRKLFDFEAVLNSFGLLTYWMSDFSWWKVRELLLPTLCAGYDYVQKREALLWLPGTTVVMTLGAPQSVPPLPEPLPGGPKDYMGAIQGQESLNAAKKILNSWRLALSILHRCEKTNNFNMLRAAYEEHIGRIEKDIQGNIL